MLRSPSSTYQARRKNGTAKKIDKASNNSPFGQIICRPSTDHVQKIDSHSMIQLIQSRYVPDLDDLLYLQQLMLPPSRKAYHVHDPGQFLLVGYTPNRSCTSYIFTMLLDIRDACALICHQNGLYIGTDICIHHNGRLRSDLDGLDRDLFRRVKSYCSQPLTFSIFYRQDFYVDYSLPDSSLKSTSSYGQCSCCPPTHRHSYSWANRKNTYQYAPKHKHRLA